MIGKIYKWLSKNENLFTFLLALVFLERLLLLLNFNFKFVGSDDLIFWQAATDYMHGVFHEPYFYGQNYNFMLEAVFAIPFIAIGVPYTIAFPLVTSCLALFPFILFSRVLFKNGYFDASFIFLLIPILLPIEYGILTSITRGFISGLFFSSFLVFAILKPHQKSSWIIAALSIALGFIVNPNSLVISFPITLYLLLENRKQLSFYVINVCLILPILLIEYMAKSFYIIHKEYNLNSLMPIDFNINKALENLNSLDVFFAYFTPIIWFAGWLILIVIFAIGVFLVKKELIKAISLMAGVLFILATLGINKVNDHIGSIFLSSGRMFLGIPLLTGLAFHWIRNYIFIENKTFKIPIVLLATTLFFIKISLLGTIIKAHTTKTNYGPVAIKRNDELRCECLKLDSIAKANKTNFILFVPSWNHNVPAMEFYNYGCPLLLKTFPKTLLNMYEKRTWLYHSEKKEIHNRLLIVGSYMNVQSKRIRNVKAIKGVYIDTIHNTITRIFAIKNNKLPLESLLNLVEIDLKRK